MRVAIVGAGAMGLGLASVLESLGHKAILHSPSGASLAFLKEGRPLNSVGAVSGTWRPEWADMKGAVTGADLVIFALPTNGMRRMIDRAAPHIESGQAVVISSHASFAALVLARRLAARGVEAPIAAWSTTLATGRRLAPDRVQVDDLRSRIDVAVLADPSGHVRELQRILFGDRFHPVEDLLALSFSNLNPPIHLANALGNLTRIEKGEAWDNYDGITPAVARLILGLDAERLALARSYGYGVKTVEEHYVHTFPIAAAPLAEMAATVHRMKEGPRGPTSLDTRYIAEDVPFGIWPLILTARAKSVPLPLHEGGLALMSAFTGRDFEAENDLLPEIGDLLDDTEALVAACKG
ncbi:NAD/NADP octopine/nopaline dehydrogenase family protein [Acuticoccus sp. M5D2P5]|uniref:NAD/NADP-dependent octopine/nopaline dehydrogenase family protein n=1 Tax=Acuticoccus kalidii TaxID=2910977 RepID=UPI001F314669|nr:NAD/NADP-dependent octopine/nopaline dehydrogenase family protein [Acuticoccus kalidii]MCF3936248.1 NAD/NADP octopine/nopaline dehydrogenase family protein [Acuticoccus kalidii]